MFGFSRATAAACALLVPVVSTLAVSGCARAQAPVETLKCMERFKFKEFPVGSWLWCDRRPPGEMFFDAAYYREYRNAGFNTAIHAFPGWDTECPPIDFDEPIRIAEETGLKVIIHTGSLGADTWGGVDVPKGKYDAEITGGHYVRLPELKWFQEKYGKSSALIGYLLNDNCGLHDYTIECAEWMLENAPDLFPYMSTNPNPVGQSKVPMPIISSQIYPFSYGPDNPEHSLRAAFCNNLESDRVHCNQYNMAMWPIIGTFAHTETPSQLRFQAYASAAYGGQALWYFAFGRGLRATLYETAQAANRYISGAAGPCLLGKRCIGVYHTGADVPHGALKPGEGQLIEAMSDQMLAGVLVREAQFDSGEKTPEYVMVVDKRTVKYPERQRIREWTTKRESGYEKPPKDIAALVKEMYAQDPVPRSVWIQFVPRVARVGALMPDGRWRSCPVGAGRSVELPALRGGEGILLRIDVPPEGTKRPTGTAWPLPPVWKFAADPKDVGVSQEWFGVGFDDKDWAAARHDLGKGWEGQGFAGYTGIGWYRQTLEIPAELGKRHLYLHFDAVDEEAWVYINGRPAFEHTCASTGLGTAQIWSMPFAFDARAHLKPGADNAIAVRVSNVYGAGGIYAPVQLVASDSELDKDQIWEILKKPSTPK